MSDTGGGMACPDGWEERRKPLSWNRRYDFSDYAETRSFLDLLADLSEKTGYYPNLNFARTHVVVAIQFESGEKEARLQEYALAADRCAQQVTEKAPS